MCILHTQTNRKCQEIAEIAYVFCTGKCNTQVKWTEDRTPTYRNFSTIFELERKFSIYFKSVNLFVK